MHVKRIEVENWLRYRGLHTVVLEPSVYAVTARYEHDGERSNWAGKTGLLFAVRFALYGDHPRPTEDGWITDDESLGRVQLDLNDGTLIERSRHRGKATRLRVVTRDGIELRDEDAQTWIVKHVGLGEKDHGETCFFKQKQMAKFVTSQPAERLKIVSAWLDLAGVQRCESNVGKRLNELLEVGERTERRRQIVVELLASVSARYPKDVALADVVETAKGEMVRLEHEACVLETRVEAGREWRAKAKDAGRYDEICVAGKELRVKAEKLPPQDEEDGQLAAAALNEARSEERRADGRLAEARRLARGEFDGVCPVMRAACPAKAKVVAAMKQNHEHVQSCEKEVEDRREKTKKALQWSDEVNAAIRQRDEVENQLTELRGQALALLPAHEYVEEHGEPPDDSALSAEADGARMKANAAVVRYEEAKRATEQAKEYEAELGRLASTAERNAIDVATHREAMLVFGRNGAQRRIAEGALARIEQGANALLAESGIDLRLAVRWSREAAGKGELAPTCNECGEPFARSQKVKECPRCGAKRGQKTVEKLDLELSNVSGAAEDLAGVAFQLAAAEWLRKERGAEWSMVEIDEPFGSLDGSTRRALATALVTMLRGRYGFEQALVVSHSQDVNDMMPKRVRILAGQAGSRLEGVD